MILTDAEKLAKELMAQFGLTPVWRFEFDDSVRRFGCCKLSYRLITLSRELTLRNDRPQVEDTIRHEIAHALCGRLPNREWHGADWKRMCGRTGAKPVRCYDSDEVAAPKGDWQATCAGCGRLHHKFRRPQFRGDRYCAHKECRMKNPPEYGQGRFNPLCKLVFRHVNALPEAEPNFAEKRKAIEAMKAQLKAAEEKS